VVVGDQRSFDGLAGAVVVPDGCGEGEDALPDAGEDSGDGAPAVLFEVALAFKSRMPLVASCRTENLSVAAR